jgi:hypothetical protein
MDLSIPLWSQFLPDTPYYRQNMQHFGLETVPIVGDGVMYVTGPNQCSRSIRAPATKSGITCARALLIWSPMHHRDQPWRGHSRRTHIPDHR